MARKLRSIRSRSGDDGRIVGGTLHSAVPGQVVVRSVPILLSVRLVVLVVVADQVQQREAIVSGHEVHAGRRPAAPRLVEVARSRQAVGEVRHLAAVPLPVSADRIAVAPIPLRPAGRKVAHLVAAFSQVPGLGDELDLADQRVLVNHVEEGREAVDLVELPGQRGGQVEAEAVDVHLRHPVPETVHQELDAPGMRHVERVAASRVVHVVTAILCHQPIVGRVVDPAEAERRPELVALGGVVVDDVEDDLDPGLVKRLDHLLELADLLAADSLARVARVRREEADRVVAPVVGEAALDKVAVPHELVDGHELDRSDAEPTEVLDGGGGGQPGVRSPQPLRNGRVARGEALDVSLVDHGQVPRRAERPIVAPGEGGVHDDALGNEGSAVALVSREVRVRVADPVPEDRVAPLDRPGNGLGIGIEQHLPRVEAMARGGFVRAVDAVSVVQTGPPLGEVRVPDLIGAL